MSFKKFVGGDGLREKELNMAYDKIYIQGRT